MEQMAKVDKRTLNGNNGTSRGKDKKPRKKPTGYYVLKDEVGGPDYPNGIGDRGIRRHRQNRKGVGR